MESYRNLGGNSGVVAYEVGPDSIRVQFHGGSVYEFTNESTGPQNIERMKALAAEGVGLNTFINTTVKNAYARKER